MPFAKGNNANPRGKPRGCKSPGSGPPPNEFKEFCKKTLHSKAARKFIEDVVAGEQIEEHVIIVEGEPQIVKTSAPAKVRASVLEWLADRGEGKVPQGVVGESGGPVTVQIIDYSKAK